MSTRPALAIALVALAAACGSSDKVTGNDTGDIKLAHGSMSAKVDGKVWRASLGLNAAFSQNILAIGGTDQTGQTLGFGVAVLKGTGTYAIAPLSAANATLYSAGSSWAATLAQGSGTITVNTITSTGASGTFSFTLAPVNQSSLGNRTVTDGVFNVTF